MYLRGGYGPGGEFAVVSNASWRVKQATLVKPRVVGVTFKGRPALTMPRDRQDFSYLWAPSCSALSQVVTFVRDVRLPGPPSEISFGWGWTAPYGGAFPGASLYVNHVLVYDGVVDRKGISHDKTKAHLAAFRDGVNHLEVRFKKKAIPPGMPKGCNNGVPSRNYGVNFVLEGKFAADVAVRTDIPATEVRHTGSLTPVTGAIDVVNNGPSTVYWGQFRFVISGPFNQLLFTRGPSVSGPGVAGCTSNTAPNTFASPIIIECTLRNMRAGTKAVIGFGLIVQIGSSGDASLRYVREVRSSADDPKPQNNTHTNTILLCTEAATNPACAG